MKGASMTENEAKEVVKKLRNKAELFKNSGFAVGGIVKSFEDSANAIETLSEEIQQYRAIGTVEQLEWCKDASHWKELFKEKLEKYEAIGTVEELQDMKNKYQEAVVDWRQYRKIGTIEEFKALKEKSVTKKVIVKKSEKIELDVCDEKGNVHLCPNCNDYIICADMKHCLNCGQALEH